MATSDSNPQAVLRDEILGDASRQGERLLRRARQEAEALLAKAKAEGEKDRLEAQKHTEEEIARRREMILASVAVEAGRTRAARVEEVLQSVYDGAVVRLNQRNGLDYRDIVVRLAAEAIRGMEGEAFQVEVAEEDVGGMSDDLVVDIARRVGRPGVEITLSPGTGGMPGGLVIRDLDGRQVWENSLVARLRRNWPVLRTEVAVQLQLVEPKPPERAKG